MTGMSGRDFYLYMTSESPDWTLDGDDVGLAVHYGGNKSILSMADEREVSYLASSIHHFVDPGSLVLSWKAEDVFSYIRGRTGISMEIPAKIYDLHVVCSWFGYPKVRPETFGEALAVLKRASREPGWRKFNDIYESVHSPLFRQVIPHMNTSCLVDLDRRSCVYPSYVLEGQANGRLKTCASGKSSYNPHSLSLKQRSRLRAPDYANFIYFDFRNMEVGVLQWLSGDENLGGIIGSGLDTYSEIWRLVAGEDPTPGKRELCKNFFLPVVFGQGKASLSRRLGISEKIAGFLIDRLVKSFPAAFDWVDSQRVSDEGCALDAFGRRRFFAPEERYKVRNFCIQAPSSVVCLKKLVELHSRLSGIADLRYHIHDGYCLTCDEQGLIQAYDSGTECLESCDPLFPGLSMKTSCNAGQNLDNLCEFKPRSIAS